MTTSRQSWTRFLSDRDQELLRRSAWAKKGPFGLGSRPAVVVVDAYYGALGLPRQPLLDAVETWPGSCGLDGWAAVDRTAPLLDVARTAGVPVYYLTGLAANPNPWNRKGSGRRPAVDGVAHHEIVAELAPQPGDVVLEKATPSAFSSTALDLLLRAAGVDTVVVCGEATSGCVRATTVDACVLGYKVAVVADCCFDRFEASHWMSLFDLDQKYADVMDADAVEKYLSAGLS
jgi:nicotinamidase-related amidase